MPKPPDTDNRQNLPSNEPPSAIHAYSTDPAQVARISMIAVPIGNLGDITERARAALSQVHELWCEDTRHTQALLNALNIPKAHLKRVDQHTSEAEFLRLLKNVESTGQWIGVVTDAGTPGISDPGAKIAELLGNFPGIRIEPLPGASAVSAFVSVAGFTAQTFSFHGFFPRNNGDSRDLLKRISESGDVINHIFFESPNRIADTISLLKEWSASLNFDARFVFAKEITKLHETLWSGGGLRFLENMQGQGFDERGEWVFSISIPKDCVINKKTEADWELTLECLIEAGISVKDASQLIAGRFSVAKKLAYNYALDLQKKVKK